MKTTNSPVIIVHLFQSKISGVTGGGSVGFLSVRNSCHVANNERKEGREDEMKRGIEGKEGGGNEERRGKKKDGRRSGGERVRQCEVTPLPLAIRCLPRTGAAARSDCTPLKQRALVIRVLCHCSGYISQGKC